MSTRLTDVGSKVLIQTIASFHGGPARAYGGVLVDANDKDARKAEMIRQADAIRKLKGLDAVTHLPVV